MKIYLLPITLMLLLDKPTSRCIALTTATSQSSLCFSAGSNVAVRGNVCLSASSDFRNGSSDHSNEEDDEWKDELKSPAKDEEALVKRKKKGKKNGEYKVLDNRDSLPFVVKVATPDPYTSAADMRKEARMNSKKLKKEQEKKQQNQKNNNMSASEYAKKKKKNPNNLYGGQAYTKADGIAASVRLRQKDGSLHKVLGEFTLNPNTNCGDLLEVGHHEYEVLKAHCQYRYAGGKRFVMVRKILEVKEVTRIAEENYLKRQFSKDTGLSDSDNKPPSLE